MTTTLSDMRRRAPGSNGAWILVAVTAAIVLLAAGEGSAQEPRVADLWVLRPALHEAYAAGDYKLAVEIGLKISRITPNDPIVSYNLACAYALSRDKTAALHWLQRSADDGFQDAGRARNDPDLTSLRNEEEFARAIAKMELAPELFEERALAGEPIVILPPEYDAQKPATLILVMHGFGGRPEGIAGAWREAARQIGAILVAPRSIHRVGANGFQWGEVEDADFIVMNTLRRIRKKHKIDPRRIVLSGFSQGGFMACCLGTLHAKEFAGVIPMAGLFDPLYAPPRKLPADERPRYYIAVGERDRVADSNRQAVMTYTKQGYAVRLRVFPGIGHTWPADPVGELRTALEFVLDN